MLRSPTVPSQPARDRATQTVVCYVTDREAFRNAEPGKELRGSIAAAVEAGVDWVQIREKNLSARDLLGLAGAAVEIAGKRARVIVNDRLDLALASGAAGVHLGGESIPARNVVRWCRAGNAPLDFLIGVSCHSVKDARDAEDAGSNYVFFGPIFDTPAKRAFGQPQGLQKLAEVCRAVKIPVIAIGGVTDENGAECVRAGAAGIAAIRFFQERRSPEALREAVARLHSVAGSR